MICGIDSHACRVALLTEGGVRHWPSAPTRTCRVATRVRTRVDFVSKRMHPQGHAPDIGKDTSPLCILASDANNIQIGEQVNR